MLVCLCIPVCEFACAYVCATVYLLMGRFGIYNKSGAVMVVQIGRVVSSVVVYFCE